jgi:hypothetical protein
MRIYEIKKVRMAPPRQPRRYRHGRIRLQSGGTGPTTAAGPGISCGPGEKASTFSQPGRDARCSRSSSSASRAFSAITPHSESGSGSSFSANTPTVHNRIRRLPFPSESAIAGRYDERRSRLGRTRGDRGPCGAAGGRGHCQRVTARGHNAAGSRSRGRGRRACRGVCRAFQ